MKKGLLFVIFVVPLMLGAGILAYWFWTTRIDKQVMLPVYGEIPRFELTSQDHRTVTDADLRGKISVVDFIFTRCAGACPVMSTRMADIQSKFSGDPHIQLVSCTVDPENDTPDVLAGYATSFNAIKGKWVFLTGTKGAIAKLSDGFHLDLQVDDTIVHSQKFILVDARGAIRGYYDSEDDEATARLLRDMHVLSSKLPS